jgi:hypothetical protein
MFAYFRRQTGKSLMFYGKKKLEAAVGCQQKPVKIPVIFNSVRFYI